MFTLQDGMSLSTVQTIFNKTFPYLKLEFFRRRHQVYGANAKKDLLKTNAALHTRTPHPHEPEINVNADMSVAALEQLFHERFGLSVQVFRKFGKTWLETSVTDDWTLKKQNDQGFELSTLNP
jgi:hypothetical protein